MRRRLSFILLLFAVLLTNASISSAQGPYIFNVNTTADTIDVNPGDTVCADINGNCSLRAAISEANMHVTLDTINVPAGIYTLTIAGTLEDTNASGDLDIMEEVTINGAGANDTIIQACNGVGCSGIDRVFHIDFVVTEAYMNNLTIRNGNVPNADLAGGGILVQGALTLNNVTVTQNIAPFNSGAGIANYGTLTISNSTISGNDAFVSAGGIYNESGDLTIINSTISGNTVNPGDGGAIVNSIGNVDLIRVTITNNTAAGGGEVGGIINNDTLAMSNSIVAGNTGTTQNDLGGVSAIISNDYNLIGDTSGATINGATTHNITNIAPGLAALADNGGPTQTHALNVDSPAIDAGSCTGFDQRGQPRQQDMNRVTNVDNACDIGAFEVQRPAANNDSYTAQSNTPLVVNAANGVLANDSHENGILPLSAVVASQPSSGSLTLNADGSFTYTPNNGFSGPDSFTYRAENAIHQTAALTVSIIVEDVSTATPTPTLTPTPTSTPSADQPRVRGDLENADTEPILEWLAPEAILTAASAFYRIIIVNSTGGVIFDQEFDTDLICINLICSLHVPPEVIGEGALLNGGYTWWIQLTINNIEQEFIEGDTFEVNAPQPVLLDFEVDTTTGRPIIRFPDNPHSRWYQVAILRQLEGGSVSLVHVTWYRKNKDLCDVNCLIIPNAHPGNGNYKLWVQTWGPAGFSQGGEFGGWAGPIDFALLFDPPQAVDGMTFTNAASGRPTFTWNASTGSTWYRVIVFNIGNTKEIHEQWVSAIDAGCANAAICTATPNFILDNGSTYQWWQQNWGPGGFSTGGDTEFDGWSNGGSFTVGAPFPTVPQLIAPVDTVTDPIGLTYTWTHQADVSWYQIEVQQTDNLPPGETPVDFSGWYPVEAANCRDDDVCNLSIPHLLLLNGNYQWRVQAYSPAGTGSFSAFQAFQVQRE